MPQSKSERFKLGHYRCGGNTFFCDVIPLSTLAGPWRGPYLCPKRFMNQNLSMVPRKKLAKRSHSRM